MQCVRCGASFEGRFCPRCGAPAVAVAAAPMEWPCPRCGTLFRGNFCPRCGLPTAAWAYRPPPPPSGGRSVLSVLWTLALVGFIVFVVTDFAALVASPAFVVPGIQAIRSGQTVNSGFDFDASNWTFDQWGSASSAAYRSAGGNLDGFLEMTLPNSGARGYWWQAFRVEGSLPFTGAVRLDIEITGALTSGRLIVAVDSANSVPDATVAIGVVHFTGPTAWTAMPRLLADDRLAGPGVYYLKIAFIADTATTPVSVGFDNVRLAWKTDAAVVVYLPAPAPFVLYFSQDRTLFIAYFAFIASVILLAAGYHLIRERREAWTAFRAPLEAIGTRLKSRSAWIALGQVWMAVTFFQVVFFYLVLAAGINPSSPVNPTPQSAWFWLYELANAGVYEEFAFRLLLIGLPMALGSVALRILDVRRGGTGSTPGAAGRHIAGAWRYLIGGAVRRDSPKETLVASWAFLIASSAIFGLAHAPGWGWWKVIPAMVAGLGFGYLFLRHGIGAAILAHFVNDYAAALSYEGFGGEAFLILLNLLFLGLAIAGAGFFAWYAIVAWRHFRGLIERFWPPTRAAATPGPAAPYFSAMPQPFATPPASVQPPPPGQPPPPTQVWSMTPSAGPPTVAVRNPSRIPREYTPSYVPPPYGYPPVRFQCPYCAWVEAKYDAGRFTCTRCGRTA